MKEFSMAQRNIRGWGRHRYEFALYRSSYWHYDQSTVIMRVR